MKKPDSKLIERWIRPEVRALSAYHVADPGDLIKLDAMENPYQWPSELVEEWTAMLSEVGLNRYPDPEAAAVQAALKAYMDIPSGAQVILGNGSDELIQMLMQSLAVSGRSVLAPQPGFVMYRLSAIVAGLDYVGVPLASDDFQLDMPAMRKAIEETNPAVVFLACPNNPTGNGFKRDDVLEIIECAPGLVVLDEAYAPFTDQTFMQDLPDFENLLVMRTVSKMGLAGLRLGLLAGATEWLEQINKTRLPYNINVLTQASIAFALRHPQLFESQATQIRQDREALLQAMQQIDSITVYPSEANFLLFRLPEGQATSVFERLREQGVLIKNLHGSDPALADCLRVTVGKPEENASFLDALKAAL